MATVAVELGQFQRLLSCNLGIGLHSPPSFYLWPNLWPLNNLLITVYLSLSWGMGTKSLGKGATTALASSSWAGESWGHGSQHPLSVRVHLPREMRVYGMIWHVVPALSGFWLGDVFVVLSN